MMKTMLGGFALARLWPATAPTIRLLSAPGAAEQQAITAANAVRPAVALISASPATGNGVAQNLGSSGAFYSVQVIPPGRNRHKNDVTTNRWLREPDAGFRRLAQ